MAEVNDDKFTPIELPKDALAVQTCYMDRSIRCFKLYGRGDYDYGVTPNADQAIMIALAHQRLVKAGAPGPWNSEMKVLVASSPWMYIIWNYWWAAGKKAGLTKDDIGRQLEAEYGIDPRPWLPVLTEAQIEQRKAEFKQQSMKLKLAMLKESPEAREYIPVDRSGQPIWDEKKHGEYVVIVVKINKGDGLTEFGSIDE